jgi:hypothetical protein
LKYGAAIFRKLMERPMNFGSFSVLLPPSRVRPKGLERLCVVPAAEIEHAGHRFLKVKVVFLV